MACGLGVCAIRTPVQHHVRSLPPSLLFAHCRPHYYRSSHYG
ncbi:hypothetical protein GQ600_20008 [Phytophthora cactorum]|nr:hypothetical protein GQ600_20008 [Phytophthora cactorum]